MPKLKVEQELASSILTLFLFQRRSTIHKKASQREENREDHREEEEEGRSRERLLGSEKMKIWCSYNACYDYTCQIMLNLE